MEQEQDQQKSGDENGNAIKKNWQKPELSVLDVEHTCGGSGFDDEGSFSFAS